jgi:hypothetical protein
MMVCWVVIAERPASSTEMWNTVVGRCGPALFASMLLLPVALIDMARMSNRFAGPILRLRRAMKDLADGREVQPIRFRDHDYWGDFAEDFNRVLARINDSAPAVASPAQTSEDSESRGPMTISI